MRWVQVSICLLTVIFCLLSVLITSCGERIEPPEPTRITFVHLNTDTAYYESLVEEFSTHYPHITVELRPKSWQLLASGSTADDVDVSLFIPVALCPLYPGRCSASPDELYAQGGVLSLNPFIAQDKSFDRSDYYKGTLETYAFEGQTLAIPMGLDPMMMYYNLDLFDKYGVPYPESGWVWDDFLRTALLIRDPTDSVYGFVSRNLFEPMHVVYQHGGRLVDDLHHPTRPTFDNPLTVEAVSWYADLFLVHDVAPAGEEATTDAFGGTIETGILLGKAGMWADWFSSRGGRSATLPVQWSMRWGIAALPRDARPVTTARVGGYFISSHARHPEACYQWIAFLSQQIPQGWMPARRSVAQSKEYGQLVGNNVAAAGQEAMEHAILLPPDLERLEPLIWTFGSGVERVIAEEATPEEAMDWAQKWSEVIMSDR